MEINPYYLVLDLSISLVITVEYGRLRSEVVVIHQRVDIVSFRLTYYSKSSK